MARMGKFEIYGGRDPRVLPAYSFVEAARYLRIPVETLRNWSLGKESARPVFQMDDPARRFLSFMNLVEAHVLTGIRKKHGVKLQMIRPALDYVRKRFETPRPLIDQSFQTDGRCLFIEEIEKKIVNASRGGQLEIKDFLPQLERIDRDASGLPVKLYPFTRPVEEAGAPKIVVVNPLVSFGRPSVRGVATSVIMSRFRAGDSPAHLASDYGLNPEEIEEALRCEAA